MAWEWCGMRTQVLPDRQLTTAWLQRFEPGSSSPQSFPLTKAPFIIGRAEECDCPIPNTRISRRHAEILLESGVYRVHDLGSTNGTFLNGQRIDSALLQDGDLLLIADSELSFHLPAPTTAGSMATQVISGSTAETLDEADQPGLEVIRTLRSLQEMLLHRTIRHDFRSVVELADQKIVGQEAIDQTFQGLRLQNIDHPLAAVQESRLLRRLYQLHRLLALEQAPAATESDWLFLHLHIAELNLDLSKQLAPLLSGRGPHNLVAQMPVADLFQLPDYADHLAQLEEMQFSTAYEGFLGGVQQLQAIESYPPTFLKLAPAMVRGIDRNRPRQTQLKALVAAVTALGSQVIGTGFHSQNEVKVCLDLGCTLGQGDLFA